MKPKIIIVDENDQEIGVKERSKMDYSVDIYRCSALWLTNSKGEVLLAQRKHTKDKDPGMWGPAVAGTVDEGETYDQNIYKEAEEEIGLTDVTFIRDQKAYFVNTRKAFVQWYKVTLDREVAEFEPQEDEVEQLAWIPEHELVQDFQKNPSKYIPAMPVIIEMFCKDA